MSKPAKMGKAAALPLFLVRVYHEVEDGEGRLLATLVRTGRGVCQSEALADTDRLATLLQALGVNRDDVYGRPCWYEWYAVNADLGLLDATTHWDKAFPDYALQLSAQTLVPESQEQALEMYSKARPDAKLGAREHSLPSAAVLKGPRV